MSSPYDDVIAASMSEDVLLDRVLGIARLNGWRSAHFRPAQTQRGRWVTAVQGDGKGFPDLVLVHGPAARLVIVELKSARGRTTAEQALWLENLEAVARRTEETLAMGNTPPVEVHIWRPVDLIDGSIENVLRVSVAHRTAAR